MDRATRYGSCVPVTTIGIAPVFGPETSGRRIRRLTCKCCRQRHWGALKADVDRHSHMTWFASIRMLLRHFPRKVGACTVRHGAAFPVSRPSTVLLLRHVIPDAQEAAISGFRHALLRQDKCCEAKSSRVCGFPDREVRSRFL